MMWYAAIFILSTAVCAFYDKAAMPSQFSDPITIRYRKNGKLFIL